MICRQGSGRRKVAMLASTASESEQDESQMSEEGEAEVEPRTEAEEETEGDQETDNATEDARAAVDEQPLSPSKLLLSTCLGLMPAASRFFCKIPPATFTQGIEAFEAWMRPAHRITTEMPYAPEVCGLQASVDCTSL